MFSTLFFIVALECSPGVQEAREFRAMIQRVTEDTRRMRAESRQRLQEAERLHNELRRLWGLPPLPPVPPMPLPPAQGPERAPMRKPAPPMK
jgi:hypothetical protein